MGMYLLMRLMVLAVCFTEPVSARPIEDSLSSEGPTVLPDIVIADFEGEDYGDWEVSGQAFGSGPARGPLSGQMPVSGYKGKGLVNSFTGGDGTIGVLTSPAFKIERRYINFLIGGGGFPGLTCINLLAEGKAVRAAVGPNTRPGGSEQLEWHTWDVSDLSGRTVRIQIVDQHTGGWGHINIDHIVQSESTYQMVSDQRRTFEVRQHYLNFPVKNGAPKRLINLFVEGEHVRQFDIELASETPDFWVFLDIREFKGKEAAVQIDRYSPAWETGFDAIFQGDTFPGEEPLYREAFRPQFHFSSRRGWLNDTNGMVYYDGQYHLFYQHNPYGWNWGNMTWGHAVSPDMIYWKEWGDAIHPDALGTIYSGSAVVDEYNTAGFQTGSEKTLVAIYTSAGGENFWSKGNPYTQSLAYSNDRGKSWTKYEHNPVIGPIQGGTRDPKVFWHEPSHHWVMVLWIDGKTLSFFTSPDLKTWKRHSDVEGFFECPELFELPVDGNPSQKKWVICGANGDYCIGGFDGKAFKPEGEIIRFQYGNCFYASQTFNHIPPSDGRRLQMAWGRIDMPEMPFNQMILFPVELTLRMTEDGIRLFTEPIREIKALYGRHWQWKDLTVRPDENPLKEISGELLHIKAELELKEADFVSFVIRGVPVQYDVQKRQLTCADKAAPLEPMEGNICLEILVDRMSIEIYANDGLIYMPMGVNLVHRPAGVQFVSQGGQTHIKTLDIYQLKSIWH